MRLFCAVLAAGLFCCTPVDAADFYLDPESGSPMGDGSEASPWGSLQSVVEAGLIESRHWKRFPHSVEGNQLQARNSGAPVKAGDTLHLMSGDHGAVSIVGYYNTETITVMAVPGQTPKLSKLLLQAASHWAFRGLMVSPSFSGIQVSAIVDIDSHGWQGPSHDIELSGSTIYTVEDASGWGAEEWARNLVSGIVTDGERTFISNNEIRNTRFGITVMHTAKNSRVRANRVLEFSGDGIRGLASFSTYDANVVANAYQVDGNHSDGFQSWSIGPKGVGSGEVVGVALRGNLFITHENLSHPFRASFQGIGCFDGFFVDWIVENNVVVSDQAHGITFGGARNIRIINNSAFDPTKGFLRPPRIRVFSHKDGRRSSGVVMRNNLAHGFDIQADDTEVDHNLVVRDDFFADGELRLAPGSPPIDAGISDLAPLVDRDGIQRPQGEAIDVGAYEVGSDSGSGASSRSSSPNPRLD